MSRKVMQQVLEALEAYGYYGEALDWTRHVAALRAALAEQAQPVATLHDDGCFTWKSDEFRRRYERYRAGWHMDVYATPPAPVAPPGWRMVPVEPTEAMLVAAWGSACDPLTRAAWGRMLAAAEIGKQL